LPLLIAASNAIQIVNQIERNTLNKVSPPLPIDLFEYEKIDRQNASIESGFEILISAYSAVRTGHLCFMILFFC
jgi:hypothetical protein